MTVSPGTVGPLLTLCGRHTVLGMTDDATTRAPAAATDEASMPRRCPWCSELLPVDATVRCPSCNANLVAEGEARLPGLTEVETPSATKARLSDAPKRSKLLSWISGDLDDVPSGPMAPNAAPDALALPPRDVRREMLRLQLQAEGLTVAEDGSIELSPTGTAEVVAEAVDAEVDAGDVPAAHGSAPADAEIAPEEVRKAS